MDQHLIVRRDKETQNLINWLSFQRNKSKKPTEPVFNEPAFPVMPVTLNDIIIGQDFIYGCMVLELDYKWVLETQFPHTLNLCPQLTGENPFYQQGGQQTLKDLLESAEEQLHNYIHEYGQIQSLTPPFYGFKNPEIGDEVSTLRTSRDDLDLLYGEITEDRTDKAIWKNGLEYSPRRADGDARFEAQNDEYWIDTPDRKKILRDPENKHKPIQVTISGKPIPFNISY